jgi:hypothetical protein
MPVKRNALICLIAFLFGAATLHAGNFYLHLRINPPTTAFEGVPAAGGFSGTSTLSGPGTWQLFAWDDLGTDFGIQSFNVKLSGTIPSIFNRSPRAFWEDSFLDSYDAGFALSRSGTNINPIKGLQDGFIATPAIGGFGKEASNFSAKIPDAVSISATNGQWGNYAASLNFGPTHPVFLAEGTYTGAPPEIAFTNSSVSVFTNANLTTTATVPQLFPAPFDNFCFLCVVEISNDGVYNKVIATTPGFIAHTFSVLVDVTGPPALTWTNPAFESYNGPGGNGPLPSGVDLPTFNTNNRTITWNTTKAPIGTYKWSIQASAQGYSDTGYLTVSIVAVPEPATIVLLSIVSFCGLARRRRCC